MSYSITITTCESEEQAELLATKLLELQLVACVQLIPIKSMYRWKGNIEKSHEIMLYMKTRSELFEHIQNVIVDLHTYEIPEIIQLPIEKGVPDYLRWIDTETLK